MTFEKPNCILALKRIKLKKRNLQYQRNNIRRSYIECVLADLDLDGIYFQLDESPQTDLIDSIILVPDIHDEIDADSEFDISDSDQKFYTDFKNGHEETDRIIRELDDYYKETYKDSFYYHKSEFCRSFDGSSDSGTDKISFESVVNIDFSSDVSYISDDDDDDIVKNTEPVNDYFEKKTEERSESCFSLMRFQKELSDDENKEQSFNSLSCNSFENCYSTDDNIGMKQSSIDMKSGNLNSEEGDANSGDGDSESLRLGLSLHNTIYSGLKETGYPQLEPDALSDTGVSEVSHGTDAFSDATEDDTTCLDLSTYQAGSVVRMKLHKQNSISSENKDIYKKCPNSVNVSNEDIHSFDCESEDSDIKSPQRDGKDSHVISDKFNQDLIDTSNFGVSDESRRMENEKTQNVTCNSFGEKEEIAHSFEDDVNCGFSNNQQVLPNNNPIFSLNSSDRSFNTEETKSLLVTTSETQILSISHDTSEIVKTKPVNLLPSRPVRIPGGVALPGMAELHKNTVNNLYNLFF